ncbi:MAG: hypothetical protein KF718_10935 [Polyangiaceae bacterium]|nr:hypothetical protein [Polyangiaceae bacterium]
MSVTLLEVMSAARGRAACLAAEVAGYLVLGAADHVLGSPRDVSSEQVLLEGDGSVRVHGGHPTDEIGAERGLRRLLAALLLEASGVTNPLLRASRRAATGDVEAFVREVESALIPVNRGAGRRALARLHRDTERAKERGLLVLESEPAAHASEVHVEVAAALTRAAVPPEPEPAVWDDDAVASIEWSDAPQALAQHESSVECVDDIVVEFSPSAPSASEWLLDVPDLIVDDVMEEEPTRSLPDRVAEIGTAPESVVALRGRAPIQAPAERSSELTPVLGTLDLGQRVEPMEHTEPIPAAAWLELDVEEPPPAVARARSTEVTAPLPAVEVAEAPVVVEAAAEAAPEAPVVEVAAEAAPEAPVVEVAAEAAPEAAVVEVAAEAAPEAPVVVEVAPPAAPTPEPALAVRAEPAAVLPPVEAIDDSTLLERAQLEEASRVRSLPERSARRYAPPRYAPRQSSVDSLLESFAVGEIAPPAELCRDLKAIAGVEATALPPPVSELTPPAVAVDDPNSRPEARGAPQRPGVLVTALGLVVALGVAGSTALPGSVPALGSGASGLRAAASESIQRSARPSSCEAEIIVKDLPPGADVALRAGPERVNVQPTAIVGTRARFEALPCGEGVEVTVQKPGARQWLAIPVTASRLTPPEGKPGRVRVTLIAR